MGNEILRLKRALAYMMRITAVRADGEAYVPIVLRLEREIAERETMKVEYDRIKQLTLQRAA